MGANSGSGNGRGARQRSPERVGSRWRLRIPPLLFSMKFAIWLAVLLALASVAGVLVQEFFPVRDEQQAAALAQRLPGPMHALFVLLQLHDPFRALWFRTLLGLLALSLGLCAAKNFRPNFRQALRVQLGRLGRRVLVRPTAMEPSLSRPRTRPWPP